MAEDKTSKKKKGGKSPLKPILIILVLLGISGGIAFFVVSYLNKENVTLNTTFENISLKPELITFTHNMMPTLYDGLSGINKEILLIENEVNRLIQMEKEFPLQKKIIISEKTKWKKIKKELLLSLSILEKDVEMIYVSYSVNQQKGLTLIEEKSEDLSSLASNTISTSQELTHRLVVDEEKKFLDTIKDKFL